MFLEEPCFTDQKEPKCAQNEVFLTLGKIEPENFFGFLHNVNA